MKIKQTILAVILLLGFVVVLAPNYASAASCGGVTTNIIGCDQDVCVNGKNPIEGFNPGKLIKNSKDAIVSDFTASEKSEAETKNPVLAANIAYTDKYKHDYGRCDLNGTKPSTEQTNSGIWGLLLLVINILTAGVGVAAVGGIVYGSILYTTAAGSAEQTKKAITIIKDVVLGLLAYMLMYSILNFIVPGGFLT